MFLVDLVPCIKQGGRYNEYLQLGFKLSFQTAPDASVAANIVYRHVPSATCVSEVSS